eukprot:1051093-Ditylum_brightwellii.AAC.1
MAPGEGTRAQCTVLDYVEDTGALLVKAPAPVFMVYPTQGGHHMHAADGIHLKFEISNISTALTLHKCTGVPSTAVAVECL